MDNRNTFVNPNKLLRREANQVIGKNFGTLLLMMLLTGAVSAGFSVVSSLMQTVVSISGIAYTGTSVIDQSSIIRDYGAAVEPSLDVFAQFVQNLAQTPAMTTFAGMTVLSVVTSIGLQTLNLGSQAGYIRMMRGERVKATCVFSRMSSILRVIGLNLWVGLLQFLWMLPGLLLVIGGVGYITTESIPPLILLDVVVGYILMLVMGMIAVCRYAMASWALADEPKQGVFKAVSRSVTITWRRKFQLFRLTMPHVLLLLLFIVVLMLNFVLMFCMPPLFVVLGIFEVFIVLPALICMASVLFNLCTQMTMAAFYVKYNPYHPVAPVAPAAPVMPAAPAAPVVAVAPVPAEAPAPAEVEVPVPAAADEVSASEFAAEPAEARPVMPAEDLPEAERVLRPVIPAAETPDASAEPRPVLPAEPTAPIAPVALEEILPPTLSVEPDEPAQPE